MNIYHTLNQLCTYNYSTLECFKTIHPLFYYHFPNISEYKRNEIAKQWMDTIVTSRPVSNAHYCKLVYKWYHSIEKKDVVGYPATMIDRNIQNMVDFIKPYARKNTWLVDIGSYDCQLINDVSSMVGMKPVLVKLPHTKYSLDICKQIDTIPYKQFDKIRARILLFNYSLHHFTSEEEIQHVLRQVYNLLEPGGIILIRDHDSTNDEFIDLQHVVLEMKFSNHLPLSEYQSHMKKYIGSLKTHYFNVESVKEWCKKIGFTYRKMVKQKTNIKDECNRDVDISNTVYVCFQKSSKTQRVKFT